MKKNFVRSLVVAVMAVAVLGGCGNQQTAATESTSQEVNDFPGVNITEEEFERLCNSVFAEERTTQEVKDFPGVNITDEEFEWLCRSILAEKYEFPWGHATLEEYYQPTEEERQMAYFMACAQALGEEQLVQTMETNVAINIAIKENMNLIDVFNERGWFSGMHDGVPSFSIENEDGSITWIPVTEDLLTDEVKEAVDLAFFHDYTDGAIHYYDITKVINPNMPEHEDYFQRGNIIFVRQF